MTGPVTLKPGALARGSSLFAGLLLAVLSPVLFVICAAWIMSTVSLDLEKTRLVSDNLESVSLIVRTDR